MLEALSMPASAVAFSLPAPSHHHHGHTSRTEIAAAEVARAAAQANFAKLQTTALPLLFAFAQQQQQQQQLETLSELPLASAEQSFHPSIPLSEVAEALQSLAQHLDSIRSATRCDGRRHVAALPPPVVAALWDRVMPFLHAQALPRENSNSSSSGGEGEGGSEDHTMSDEVCDRADGMAGGALLSADASYAEGSNGSGGERAAAAAVGGEQRRSKAALSLAPSPSVLKAPYTAVRRALALHTRNLATLLSPDVVAVVLTRLYQCGALADDVLGPVIADLLEKQHHGRSSSSSSTPTPTVGGTITVLQRWVLRLDEGWSESNASPASALPSAFHGAAAITMARLLGKASLPGHHQLHRFFHLALLPEVTRVLRCTATAVAAQHHTASPHEKDTTNAAAQAAGNADDTKSSNNSSSGVALVADPTQPGVDALLDLTSAFRHYAVSGEAVQHLTALWAMQFELSAQVSWGDCAAVLRALSTLPHASSRSRRRQARQLSRHAGGRQEQLLAHVAEEDYYALVEEVYAQVRQLSGAAVTTLGSTLQDSNASAVVDVPPAQLLALLRMLLHVNSPRWAETYDALATVVVAQLASQLSSSATAGATTVTSATDVQALLERAFPLPDTQRTLKALLHRNSLIPDHRLHRLLLRRVLHAPEALTDASVAATALLGLEVMIPAEEGGVRAASLDAVSDTSSTLSNLVHASPGEAFTITAHDRARALQVLRRRGRSMNPSAFIAGLCVAPIDQLPLSTQSALVNHLSSVASAVAPAYLVKGMAAVVRQLRPAALDDVSVQRWYSRFTAVDVVRRVDSAGCAVLLEILSANPRVEMNCALAKQAITRQIGVALLRAGGDDDGASLTLGQLPPVLSALRRANVFFPPYFSRVCRLLLGQVESAPLGDLLLPFSATAEEFMRRHQREGQASVFRDVWELLRGRVLDQVATLSLDETCTALNAFAALDVGDRALFRVLVHHLWVGVRREALIGEARHGSFNPSSSSTAAAAVPSPVTELTDESGGGAAHEEQEVKLLRHADGADPPSGRVGDVEDDEEEAQEALVRRAAQLGQRITQTLSPSAVAVVVATLCARADAAAAALQTRADAYTEDDNAALVHQRSSGSSGGGDTMASTMLPWMLLALRRCHAELYPIDVVHVLPALVQRYTTINAAAAAVPASTSPPRSATTTATTASSSSSSLSLVDVSELALLHAAFDACRTTFLSMYAVLPDPAVLSATTTSTEEAASASTAIPTAAADEIHSHRDGSTLTSAEIQRIAAQRAQWTPAVKMSVQVVPRPWFATLLLALSSADLADIDVGVACVERACTRRVCGSLLTIDQLVDLCLTMCWLSRASATTTTGPPRHDEMKMEEEEVEGSTATCGDAASTAPTAITSTSAAPLLRTAMATVLSALWYRSEELHTRQINALLRCLRDTYGAERVDADFVQRLEAQKALIRERRRAAAAATADTSASTRDDTSSANAFSEAVKDEEATKVNAETPATTTAPRPETALLLHADDLFSVM
ncbi:hypothetical protein ABB37_09663 [Leptomonas pyrrhocoris]|uniref:Uncharacterized protein n=1 Tax=Leptomonas pyrrhocoris TaxID=157538 RepID=A0A0N0VCX5_LEPPY|nr:hypothetical protein ABB37_09663 [Leptomonas pyrrhocoris]XP_015652214.1 hypothetical protein ABB37_09663 [Leptomonas pyrrhocoris]KPA73774.1 hypothetical protein ABB37_09663 [Leptomonas pyrrhocoris]KPA73775.1 hypothetical protein ABB37_09663 [Leptomonas pyrrhocoris]|eukprot:XP_015652213.1 hypothetical protein ABB37_09663 [Leptomonas pyrrhocoris]